jgi:hypothetical protein
VGGPRGRLRHALRRIYEHFVNGWELLSEQLNRLTPDALYGGAGSILFVVFVWVALSPFRHKPRHLHRHIYQAPENSEEDRGDERREILAEEPARIAAAPPLTNRPTPPIYPNPTRSTE